MASTESRFRKLISENLEVDGQPLSADLDLNTTLTDHGVSSMDLVSFAAVIQDEFNVKLSIEQCAELPSLSAVIEYLDANSA